MKVKNLTAAEWADADMALFAPDLEPLPGWVDITAADIERLGPPLDEHPDIDPDVLRAMIDAECHGVVEVTPGKCAGAAYHEGLTRR